MLDFDILTVIISLTILIISLFFIKYKRKVPNVYLVYFSIFFVYLIGVLKYTIFPIPLDPFMKEVMLKETTFLDGINLIPFMSPPSFKQTILNMVLSMPFGFGISYITRISKKKLILLGVSFGIIIELLQLMISLLIGFTYRSIDINDVIVNFIGVIMGYLIFRLFSTAIIKYVDKFNLELDPISNYAYIVAKASKS